MHVREIIENDAGQCGISIDFTWQKHSYSSHTMVSLQQFPLTQRGALMLKSCPTSASSVKWSKKQNDPKYQEWKANHQCKMNYTGSSGSMGTAGALRIFERSSAIRETEIQKHAWRWLFIHL